MAKNTQETRARAWFDRLFRATKEYDEWNEKYRASELEDLYLGHHYKEPVGPDGKEKYIVNLAFPSVEIRIPSLLFYRPKIDIDVQEPFEDQPGSNIAERTKLLEDTANTFIADCRVGFQNQALLALRESFYRYGVIEVGYSGDFIDNPNAGKPMLHDDGSEMQVDGQPVLEPQRKLREPRKGYPSPESVYVRRIPAHQFRVSVGSNNRLDWCDWCGYYEWEYVEDVKANPAYKNVANLKPGGAWKNTYTDPKGRPQRDSDKLDSQDERRDRSRMVKLWKIWDIRTKTKLVFAEGAPKALYEEPFEFLPFAVLKFHDIMDSFYPLPPMFNWRLPQQEMNSTRQTQKTHQERFKRRYQYLDGSVNEEELQKLETGPDGTYIKVNMNDAISSIEDAPLDSAVWRNIPATKDDFMQVSGVGGEARGEASAATATQASIIDTRARIRESFSRYQVSLWLADIVRLLLYTIRTNMLLPFVIKRNVDTQAPDALPEAIRVGGLWEQIQAEDLDELNYEVSVDVESLSPVNEDTERQQWMAWMSSLTPQRLMMMMTSDTILRRDLGYFGIRGDKQILEIKKALEAQLLAMSGQSPLQAVLQARSGGSAAPGMQGAAGNIPIAQPGQGAPEGAAGPTGGATQDRINAQINAQMQRTVPGASVQTAP